MVPTKNSMSGHVQGCPAVQPEPLAQRADLLALDQLTDGPPEPPPQGVVGYVGFLGLGVRVELILPVCTKNLNPDVVMVKSAQDGA
jgi:hypothetical protein